MVTPGVGVELRACLGQVFDHVLEVPEWRSLQLEMLSQLGRPELAISLTKLHCWTLTQYRKAVFMDSDTMVLQNIDDLFEREELSAAPDPGWPDCFNSGVFVFCPSMATYHALQDFASTNGSFDGGDQGLLNFFFSNWVSKDFSRRLPFVYNLSWSSIYSHQPAFERFRSSVRVVHFLGAAKPWHFHCPDGGLLAWLGGEEPFGGKGQSAWCTTLAESPMPVGAQEGCLRDWWHLFRSKVQPLLEAAGIDGLPTESKQAAFITHYPSSQFPHLLTSCSATPCCLPESIALSTPSCTPYVCSPCAPRTLAFSLPARVSPTHFISPSLLDHLDSKAAGPSASTFTARASAREGKQKAKDSLWEERDKSKMVRFAGGIEDLPLRKGQDEGLLLQEDQDWHEDLLLGKDQDEHEHLPPRKDQDQNEYEHLSLRKYQDQVQDEHEHLPPRKDQVQDEHEHLPPRKYQVLDEHEHLPLRRDQDAHEDLPLRKDQYEHEDHPLWKDRDPDEHEDLPLQRDHDTLDDLPLRKDQYEHEDHPLWKDRDPDEHEDLLLQKDQDEHEDLLLRKDPDQDEHKDHPLWKDRDPDEHNDLPLQKDQDEHEDLPLQKDQDEHEDLPLQKDQDEHEDLPLQKDQDEHEDLPLQKDQDEHEDLPLQKDQDEHEDLPLQKDQDEHEDLPLQKDQDEHEDLPLQKDPDQDEHEDLLLRKDPDQDEHEDLPLRKDQEQDEHEELLLRKDQDLPVGNIEMEKEETADEHEEARRKKWELGMMDYLGEDSFENIQRHLDEML
uniref:glycogenin glucosyltransferase n=1 Tax=Eptatretus burgeri TaxID=7764 RepID=A0A8C4WVZ2_EPTBU